MNSTIEYNTRMEWLTIVVTFIRYNHLIFSGQVIVPKTKSPVTVDPPMTGKVRSNAAVEILTEASFKFQTSPTTKLLHVRGSSVPPENSGFLLPRFN